MDMIYVTTKYLGATTHQGSRIRVDDHNGTRKIVPFDYAFPGDAHVAAILDVMLRKGINVDNVRQLCPSESGNGSVWEVTISQ